VHHIRSNLHATNAAFEPTADFTCSVPQRFLLVCVLFYWGKCLQGKGMCINNWLCGPLHPCCCCCRRVATLWDLRQQLLALHGLREHKKPRACVQLRQLPPNTEDVEYYSSRGALRLHSLMATTAVQRFFSAEAFAASRLAELPAVRAKGPAACGFLFSCVGALLCMINGWLACYCCAAL
jgi:hypothetical protein